MGIGNINEQLCMMMRDWSRYDVKIVRKSMGYEDEMSFDGFGDEFLKSNIVRKVQVMPKQVGQVPQSLFI